LAVLTKPSASPLLLMSCGLAVCYLLWANRRAIVTAALTMLWGMGSFVLLLIPWMAVGGIKSVLNFVRTHIFGPTVKLWSIPDTSLLSEALFYWQVFPIHMGRIMGWIFLGGSLAVFVTLLMRKDRRADPSLIFYLALSLALYAVPAVTPNKNYFVGLSYFLLLWVFSWTVLAPLLKAGVDRSRFFSRSLVAGACTYALIFLGGAIYALHHWPAEDQMIGLRNRAVTQKIASDLGSVLSRHDRFITVNPYGYPSTLQYYMMKPDGTYPIYEEVDVLAPPKQEIHDRARLCKAVLVFESSEMSRYSTAPAIAWPFWEAIAKWVKDPQNGYSLAGSYHLSGRTPVGRTLRESARPTFTIEVYLKASEQMS
jgi:hypothetical protein